MNKEDITQVAEVNATTTEDTTAADATVEATEETLGNALNQEEKKVPDSIPYSRFQEKVSETKELKEKIAELERKVLEGDSSKREISSDIDDIANEFQLDAKVLDKVVQVAEARAMAKVEEKLAPLQERESASKRETAFSQMLSKALEQNPEYAEVVNKDLIKQLAFNPANANKTFSKLLEEMYGSVVKPAERKTMETTAPGKSDATIENVDYRRAQSDSAYFKQIMADPTLKKEYNEINLKNLQRY